MLLLEGFVKILDGAFFNDTLLSYGTHWSNVTLQQIKKVKKTPNKEETLHNEKE